MHTCFPWSYIQWHRHTHTHTHTHRHPASETHTHTHSEWQTQRQTHRHTGSHRESHSQRHIQTQTVRHPWTQSLTHTRTRYRDNYQAQTQEQSGPMHIMIGEGRSHLDDIKWFHPGVSMIGISPNEVKMEKVILLKIYLNWICLENVQASSFEMNWTICR